MAQSKLHESPFIKKMNRILQNGEFQNIIRWSQNKTMIDILDVEKMQETILPTYFRHNKFPSFIRQLNLYGFKKIRKPGCVRFSHQKLQEGGKILSIGPRKRDVKPKEQKTESNEEEQNVPTILLKQLKEKVFKVSQTTLQTQENQNQKSFLYTNSPNVPQQQSFPNQYYPIMNPYNQYYYPNITPYQNPMGLFYHPNISNQY